METKKGYIGGINGSVITIKGNDTFKMRETVVVGQQQLIGEVIALRGEDTIAQVYEVTSGLMIHDDVIGLDKPLSVKLGPGIIGNVFDGIQRPLDKLLEASGQFIDRGKNIDNLDIEKKWDIEVIAKVNDMVSGGAVLATTQESTAILHKIMVPHGISGKVTSIVNKGSYTVNETIAVIENNKQKYNVTMVQDWPVRTPRPYKNRKTLFEPLVTGQRVFDILFPIAKGGAGTIPGGFGTGKTMTQHQFAKWSNADIIVYIGCGERGNEITSVLEEFPELIDPKSGNSLMDRTILIANTSNMPVAAREASIYTGISLAEYYRDMGYHVAIMADSTSRWAEALREISGRLEEMPAEEGFPAYLQSRLSEFYERAGYVTNFDGSTGSITVIGAVSPQGGDFSEPVTMNTKRFVRCFWALDKSLAYARHYPAINWNTSYSEYQDELESWYVENVSKDFTKRRIQLSSLLQEENKLMEIVKLIGSDILPDDQKLVLETSKVIREGFLQQNAFHDSDTYVPIKKQFAMLESILLMYEKAKVVVSKGVPVSVIRKENIFEILNKMKYTIDNDSLEKFDELNTEISSKLEKIVKKY